MSVSQGSVEEWGSEMADEAQGELEGGAREVTEMTEERGTGSAGVSGDEGEELGSSSEDTDALSALPRQGHAFICVASRLDEAAGFALEGRGA